MRFFTPECDSDDDLWEERSAAYDDYVDSIYTSLPWPLKVLASGVSLHDGFFTKAIFAQNQKSLELEGIFGDLEMGYFSLHLLYKDVQTGHFEKIFDGKRHEVVYDEVEWLEDKRFAHRYRFDSGSDLELEFSDLELKMTTSDTMQRLVEKPCQLLVL